MKCSGDSVHYPIKISFMFSFNNEKNEIKYVYNTVYAGTEGVPWEDICGRITGKSRATSTRGSRRPQTTLNMIALATLSAQTELRCL